MRIENGLWISFALLILSAFLLSNPAIAIEKKITVFYLGSCDECLEKLSKIKALLDREFPDARLEAIDLERNPEVAERMRIEEPAIVIGNDSISIYEDWDYIEDWISAKLSGRSPRISREPGGLEGRLLSPLVVFSTGVVSGLNPCLISVIVLLAIYILPIHGRRKMLLTSLSFCLGTFVFFYLKGFLLLELYSTVAKNMPILSLALAALVMGLGAIYVADGIAELRFFERGRFIHRLFEFFAERETYAAAFSLGFLFSLYKLPCVSGVLIAITQIIARGSSLLHGLYLLTIYNLGEVAPLLIIAMIIALGMSPERVEDFKERRKNAMKILSGALMLLLGALILGWRP